MILTPVMQFGEWWAKREDLACFAGLHLSSGSKVRQYAAMIAAAPGQPLLVGCSANSAMQIYIAEAAKAAGVPGIVYVPRRAQLTRATAYAREMGAEIVEVAPGYLSVVRSRARERAGLLGRYVRWDAEAAVIDAIAQCENLPKKAKRIVVATGSGLTCAGILAGMAKFGFRQPVMAVCVSNMADAAKIDALARQHTAKGLPRFHVEHTPQKYDDPVAASLPDGGTPLDPFYAAKVLPYIKPGDCFWIPGRRASGACP